MRRKTARRASLLTVVAAAASALFGLGVIPAVAASGHSAKENLKSNCIESNYIEKLITYYPESDHLTGTGVFGTYYDELFTSTTSTAVQATGVGSFDTLYLNPSNGDTMEWVTEQWQFPDGTFAGSGLFDRTEMLKGDWVTTPVVGTSGVYLGKSGQVKWRAIDVTEPIPPAQDVISLCTR